VTEKRSSQLRRPKRGDGAAVRPFTGVRVHLRVSALPSKGCATVPYVLVPRRQPHVSEPSQPDGNALSVHAPTVIRMGRKG